MTAGQFGTMLLGLILSVLLVRVLSVQDMGVYFLALNLMTVLITIFSFGLPTTIVRRVAQYMGNEHFVLARNIVVLCLFINAVLGGGAYLFTMAFGSWIAEHLFHSIALAAFMPQIGFLIFIGLMRGFIAESFRGFHDYRFTVLFGGMISSLLTAIAVFFLWWIKGNSDIEHILWISMFSGSVALMLALFFILKKIKPLKYKQKSVAPDVNLVKDVFSISWAMWLIGIVTFLIVSADLWVVSALGSEEDVAIYAIASRLTILVTLFHSVSVAVVQPIISELHTKGDAAKLERVTRMTATINFVAASVACLFLLFFAQTLLSLVYGESYIRAGNVLIVLGFAHLVGMIFGPIEMVLMMSGFHSYYLVTAIITGAFSLILAWFLMPLFGVVGVAYALLVAGVLYSLMSWWIANKKLGYKCHISLRMIMELFTEKGLISELIAMRREAGSKV